MMDISLYAYDCFVKHVYLLDGRTVLGGLIYKESGQWLP